MTISTETIGTSAPGETFTSAIPADVMIGKTRRIVLDTNVCLDLFVFRDPRWAGLRQAMENGEVHAVTREDCRMEWLVVLNYPHLPLTEDDKPGIRAEFDRLITCLPNAAVNTFGLPICTDPDDQKFLELSLQADAEVLITKDKALLKLAKKTARKNMFAIMTPQTWHALPGTGAMSTAGAVGATPPASP